MIRFKHHIRLHPADIERITKRAGFNPSGIRMIDEFNVWIDRCLAVENAGTPEFRLTALLLQDEKPDSE